MNEQVGLGEWNEKSMKKYGQDVVAVMSYKSFPVPTIGPLPPTALPIRHHGLFDDFFVLVFSLSFFCLHVCRIKLTISQFLITC